MRTYNAQTNYNASTGNFEDPLLNMWTPGVNGLMAATCDPLLVPQNVTLFTTVTSTIYMAKLLIPRAVSPSNVVICVASAGGTFTSADAAVFNNSGTRLAVSGSLTGVLNSTGIKTIACAPGALAAGQYVHVAVRQTATTPAKLLGFVGNPFDMANAGLGASDARFATVASQTSMPSTITMGSRSTSLNCFWAALS